MSVLWVATEANAGAGLVKGGNTVHHLKENILNSIGGIRGLVLLYILVSCTIGLTIAFCFFDPSPHKLEPLIPLPSHIDESLEQERLDSARYDDCLVQYIIESEFYEEILREAGKGRP